MKKVVEIYTCDMCGKEFDPKDEKARLRSVRCSASPSAFILVHEHNPAYDDGYRDGIARERIDLCPDCAVRACAIQRDWYKDEDGYEHTKLSWRYE